MNFTFRNLKLKRWRFNLRRHEDNLADMMPMTLPRSSTSGRCSTCHLPGVMVAVRKNLDLVWVWFYKDVAPTALNMRSALGKELRKQFALEMSRTFPDFVEIKNSTHRSGARMYVRRTPQVWFFILMWPFPDRDKFGIMYGWSSSGEPPTEQLKYNPEHETNILSHEGRLERIMKPFNDVGGMEDRFWVLDDPMDIAFDRTLKEFAKPGDTEIQSLERAVTEGLSYMTSTYRETAVENLIPKIPSLVKDCTKHIQGEVIPYFEKVKELKSQNTN